MAAVPGVKKQVRVEQFDNGLEITASHLRLKDKTWAVGQIKEVGTAPLEKAGFLIPFVVMAVILGGFALSLFQAGSVLAGLLLLLVAAGSGVAAHEAWVARKGAQIWIKTERTPDVVFEAPEKAEAERVRALIERAIAQHTPA